MIDEKLPQGDEKARVVEDMFDRIAPRYDLLNRLLTFRMDVAWRRAAVNSLHLVAGARVLDLACGTGDLCRTLEAAGYQPIGVDFSAGMLAAANTDAPLVRADAMQLPFPDRALDGLTCGFALRNFVDLAPVLAECARPAPARPHRARRRRRAHERAGARCTTCGSVASFRSSAGCSPTARPTRTFRHRRPTCRPGPSCSEMVGAAGFVDVSHRTLGAGAAQLITGTRA